MPDAKIANEICERIGNKELPENPTDFQKLIHNYEGKLFGPDSAKIIKLGLEKYNYFRKLLLEDYCSSCRLENSCDWNKQIKNLRGNYFWLSLVWPIIEFPLDENELGKIVMCTHYQSKELKKQGIKKIQQPLSRLMKIIEEKRER